MRSRSIIRYITHTEECDTICKFCAVRVVREDRVRVVHRLDDPKGANPKRLAELLEDTRIIGLEDWLTCQTAWREAEALFAPK